MTNIIISRGNKRNVVITPAPQQQNQNASPPRGPRIIYKPGSQPSQSDEYQKPKGSPHNIPKKPNKEEWVKKVLREYGYYDIQIIGNTVKAKKKEHVSLELPKGAPYPYFLEDAEVVYSTPYFDTYSGTVETEVTFNLDIKEEDNKWTLQLTPVSSSSEELENANEILKSYSWAAPIPRSRTSTPATSAPANPVPTHLNIRLSPGTNPEVAARAVRKTIIAHADRPTPDVFIPTEQELAAQISASKPQATQQKSLAEEIGLGGSTRVLDEQGRWALVKTESGEYTPYWKTEKIDVQEKPSAREKLEQISTDVKVKFAENWRDYMKLGPIGIGMAAGETATEMLNEATRLNIADSPKSAFAKKFGRAVAGVVTFPFDIKHAVENTVITLKPSTISVKGRDFTIPITVKHSAEPELKLVSTGHEDLDAYLRWKAEQLEQAGTAGGLFGTMAVLTAPSLIQDIKLARWGVQPEVYEVTYTWGRAKGVLHSRSGTRAFDVTVQSKELTTAIPNRPLGQNLRIRLAVTPAWNADELYYVGAATRGNVAGTLYVPEASRLTSMEHLTTEFGRSLGGAHMAGTVVKPNIAASADDMLRFSLADYGETLAAKHVVASLSDDFWRMKGVVTVKESASAVGQIDIYLPTVYNPAEFSNHPLANMMKDLGTSLFQPDADYELLIAKALTKYGKPTVTGVRLVTKPPSTATPPVLSVEALEATGVETQQLKLGGSTRKNPQFKLPGTAITEQTTMNVETMPEVLTAPPRLVQGGQLRPELMVGQIQQLTMRTKQIQAEVQRVGLRTTLRPELMTGELTRLRLGRRMLLEERQTTTLKILTGQVAIEDLKETLREEQEVLEVPQLVQALEISMPEARGGRGKPILPSLRKGFGTKPRPGFSFPKLGKSKSKGSKLKLGVELDFFAQDIVEWEWGMEVAPISGRKFRLWYSEFGLLSEPEFLVSRPRRKSRKKGKKRRKSRKNSQRKSSKKAGRRAWRR